MFNRLDALAVHPRRRWTLLVGFGCQFAALSALLVLPLLYPQGLPEAFRERRVFLPAQSNPSTAPAIHDIARLAQGVRIHRLLVVPRPFTFNPQPSRNAPDDSAVAQIAPPSLESLARNGEPHSAFDSVFRAVPPTPPKPPVIRTSQPMEANLQQRIRPQYPALARRMGIQGRVIIRAVISREGTIEQARVLSGQPLLTGAALNAVLQWKYRPYLLNGQAVEVETEITVNFILDR